MYPSSTITPKKEREGGRGWASSSHSSIQHSLQNHSWLKSTQDSSVIGCSDTLNT